MFIKQPIIKKCHQSQTEDRGMKLSPLGFQQGGTLFWLDKMTQ